MSMRTTTPLGVRVWVWVIGYAISVILLITCILNPGGLIPGQVSGALPGLGYWMLTMVPAALATFWISRALHFGSVYTALLTFVATLPGIGVAPAFFVYFRLRRFGKETVSASVGAHENSTTTTD
jgi:hypothetical protein